MNGHYQRVARVLRLLAEQYTEQPSLEELAISAGMSTRQLHRLFTEWAGITPKDFLQVTTMSHARVLLLQGAPVLATAFATGLSGSSRLHDLSLSLQAATPGEIRSGGNGLDIRYGIAESRFGATFIATTARGLTHLSFVENASGVDSQERIRNDWPNAKHIRDDEMARMWAQRIFAQAEINLPHNSLSSQSRIRLFVRGSPFQIKVWQALLSIPPGSLTTYGNLAKAIGQPGASRATGSAVGKNPIAYLIPCHRVIRATGALGGYRWDPIRKKAILGWEQIQARSL